MLNQRRQEQSLHSITETSTAISTPWSHCRSGDSNTESEVPLQKQHHRYWSEGYTEEALTATPKESSYCWSTQQHGSRNCTEKVGTARRWPGFHWKSRGYTIYPPIPLPKQAAVLKPNPDSTAQAMTAILKEWLKHWSSKSDAKGMIAFLKQRDLLNLCFHWGRSHDSIPEALTATLKPWSHV